MATFKFNDFSIEVQKTIAKLAQQALEEVAGELESQVKRNTRVDTGQTKNSWSHRLESNKEMHKATVGSPMENAIWEEFGTGEYAINGDGRKGGWYYVDERGEGHFTRGKTPSRALQRSYDSLKNKMIKHMQDVFKGGLS